MHLWCNGAANWSHIGEGGQSSAGIKGLDFCSTNKKKCLNIFNREITWKNKICDKVGLLTVDESLKNTLIERGRYF